MHHCAKERQELAILLVQHGGDLYLKDKYDITPFGLLPPECPTFKRRIEMRYEEYQRVLEEKQ